MPVCFERSAGQVADREVKFLSRTGDTSLRVKRTAAVIGTAAVIASESGTLSARVSPFRVSNSAAGSACIAERNEPGCLAEELGPAARPALTS